MDCVYDLNEINDDDENDKIMIMTTMRMRMIMVMMLFAQVMNKIEAMMMIMIR